jgi:hypothetical protein
VGGQPYLCPCCAGYQEVGRLLGCVLEQGLFDPEPEEISNLWMSCLTHFTTRIGFNLLDQTHKVHNGGTGIKIKREPLKELIPIKAVDSPSH